MLYKKGDFGLGAILVIIIIIIFLGWLINEGWKECRVDSDCKSEQYCTSQFECKDIPVIQKAAPNSEMKVTAAAWIIGLSLIVAALIFKWDSIFKSGKKEEKKDEEEEEEELDKSHNAEEKGLYQDFVEENS